MGRGSPADSNPSSQSATIRLFLLQAAAQMSPRSTGPDGDLPSARQLRPRRTARLTELMAAMESPCGGGVPTTSQGAAGGAGGGMTKRSSGGQQGGGGGGGLAAAVSGGAGGLPITGPALEAGLAATLSGNPPQLPRQLSTRQQQMLLHRRQLLMQDAAAVNGSGGALVQDREPSELQGRGRGRLLLGAPKLIVAGLHRPLVQICERALSLAACPSLTMQAPPSLLASQCSYAIISSSQRRGCWARSRSPLRCWAACRRRPGWCCRSNRPRSSSSCRGCCLACWTLRRVGLGSSSSRASRTG